MLNTLTKVNPETLAEIEKEKILRKTHELFLLFSLGSQFDHLIKQQLDALGVFCLVADPARVKAKEVKKLNPVGIVLSGGPASAYEYPPFDTKIFDLGIPLLGICLGFQMWAYHIGVKVSLAEKREFGTHSFSISPSPDEERVSRSFRERAGRVRLKTSPPSPSLGRAGERLGNIKNNSLLAGIPKTSYVLESHGDKIWPSKKLTILGKTEHAPVSAAQYKHLYGVQFHPEVTETEFGKKIFENFVFGIAKARDRFPAVSEARKKIQQLQSQIKGKKVLLALSGGTDSSVVAYLLKKSISNLSPSAKSRGPLPKLGESKNVTALHAVYIKGIDRPDDEQNVIKYFGKAKWLSLKIVDASKEFLKALKGKTTMQEKRLAMRSVYKKILEAECRKTKADFLAQGTLYTDVSESGFGYNTGAKKAQIKLHHNVNLGFKIPELCPLLDCVKDTARQIGRQAGTPEELLLRHPFPGPGLIVRIEGEVTEEKLHTARKVDGIYIEELKKYVINSPLSPGKDRKGSASKHLSPPLQGGAGGGHSLYQEIWQAGAVVTASQVTCTKGDGAAEGHLVALWAVWSVNGFTARAAELPYDFLKKVSQRITNEVREVGGVVYRISDKPPVTIEWG